MPTGTEHDRVQQGCHNTFLLGFPLLTYLTFHDQRLQQKMGLIAELQLLG